MSAKGFIKNIGREGRRKLMIKTYIKKPLPVQAVYLKEDTPEIIMKLLDSCITKYETIIDMKDKSKIVGFLIHSWEGAEPQFLGDDYYIIKGIKGEAYPCEGNVFRDSYEEKEAHNHESF